MSLGQAMKNPIVWGGGAVLGIFMLMRSSPANANISANMDAVNPTLVSANVQMNAAAYGARIEEAKIAAQLGATKFQADVADHALFYHWLENQDNNTTVLAQARAESAAGVANSLIQSNTAIVIDAANNANRLSLGYQQVEIAQIQSNRDVTLGYYQYKAQKAASKNALIGTIVGTVGSVAQAAILA